MTPVEAVRAVFAHAGKGEWDELEAHFSDDLVIHEPASLPYGGEWHGRDALRRLYATVMGYWEDPEVVVDAIVDGEEWAVAILRFTMTSKVTGERFTQFVSEATRVADGKVVEMRIHYFDTAELVRQTGR